MSLLRMNPLEVYLQRADRQPEEKGWLLLAREGADAAIGAWEREAVLLYDSAEDLAAGRAAVEKLLAGEVEARFTEWLVKRFFEKLPAASLTAFHTALGALNLAFLYRTTDGRIDVEEGTGDPLLKTAEGLEADRAGWRTGAQAGIDEVLASWRASVEAAAPELLAAIPADRREAASAVLAGYGERSREGLRRELDALFIQEESGFVARRLSDRYSLRRKSEQATAEAVASRLILETKEETAEGIRALEAGLRQHPEAPAGVAVIDAEAWQRSFAAALEAGLATWDAAEEKLLVDRVEWERQAGRDYTDGERAWAKAYQRLREERANWEGDIRKVLAVGEEQWRERQGELAGAIRAAAAELEREMQSRAGSKSEEIESLVDMYAQASSMIATALASGGYWLEKIKVSLGLESPYADIAKAAKAPTDGSSIEAALEQVRYWQGVRATYAGHVDAARARLASVYALILDDDGRPDPLRSILSDTDPGSVCLDEYQVELLKARAVADYWEGQYGIAEAVDRYARDLSSGRATEAQSEARYRDALAGYASGKEAYAAAVLRLEQAGASLSGREGAIQDALAQVRREKDALEKARADYDTRFALYASGGGEFFAAQLRDRYRTMLDLMGFGGEQEDSLGAVMTEYLRAARRHGCESSISLASADIALLVKGLAPSGAAQQGLPSLAALRETAAALRVPGLDAIPISSEELGVALDHPYRSLLDDLLAKHASATGLERQFWAGQSILLAGKIKSEAEAALEAREQAIRLLACVDGAGWYESATGRDLAAGQDVGEALAIANNESSGAYLLARARRELEGLARWQQWESGGEPARLESSADFLAYALRKGDPGLDTREAGDRAAALAKLISFLSAGRLDLGAHREELRGLLAGELWLEGFVVGQGCFTLWIEGKPVDCAALGLGKEWAARERMAGLYDCWRRYADTAPCLAGEREKAGREALASALAKAGLLEPGLDGETGVLRLKDPSDLAGSLPVADARAREQWISDLAVGLREAQVHLPGWLSEQVQAWFNELAAYAAAAAARSGPHPASGRTAEAAGGELDSIALELEEVRELRGKLTETTDPVAGLAELFARLRASAPGTGALGGAAGAGFTLDAVAESLTGAAGISVASRVLASGEDPAKEQTWDSAFARCFAGAGRAPEELKDGIIARARELLGIECALDGLTPLAEMSGEERRVYACALWNGAGNGLAGAGIVVSPHAEAIYGLRLLLAQGAAEGEIDAWEAGLSEDAARAAARLLRERLASCLPEQRDAIFLSALCGEGIRARIEECHRLALVGGAVLERAICLDLAGQLGGPRARAILDLIGALSGLESRGAIDPAAFGNSDYDVELAAFTGLEHDEISADALAYFIKKSALAGRDTSGLTAGLDGLEKQEVDRFLAFLRDLRCYLPGVGESEESFARSRPSGRDAAEVSRYVSALRTGVWDDPIFAAALGSAGKPSGFLETLFGIEAGGLGAATTLIDLAGGYLAGLGDSFADRHSRLAAVMLYRQDYETARAAAAEGGAGNYREYLVSGNLTAKEEDDSLASTLAAAADFTDAGNMAHCEGADPQARALENGALDAFNRLARAGVLLESSLSEDGEAEAAEIGSAQAFARAMSKFTRGEDPAPAWLDDDERLIPAEIIAGYAGARGALDRTLNAISAAQAEIVRLGSALESWRSSAEAEPDRTPVNEARERFETVQTGLQQAIDDFRSASETCDAACVAARAAYSGLEAARLERDTQAEIHEYAASGYLRGSGDETGGPVAWRSPAQQLERVKDTRDRALAALSALEGVIADGQLARFSIDGDYLGAMGGYRDSMESYLALKGVQGELIAEIARQEAVVAEKEGDFDRAARRIVRADSLAYTSGDPRVRAENLEALLDPDSPDNEYNSLAIAYFCRLEAGERLRLAYDPQSYAFQKNTDWTALKEYVSGESELGAASAGPTFQQELRQWITDMDALLAGSSDPVALLARWGLAAGYVKQRLHEANEGSADTAARTAGKALADGAAGEMLDADQQLRAFLSTNHDKTVDLDCTGFIRQEGEKALAGLSGRERELFGFYLAMEALGGTEGRGASFFSDSSLLAAWSFLEQRLDESAAIHTCNAKTYGEVGAGFWIAGIIMNILPGAGVCFMAEALVLFGMAASEQNEAQSYAPVIADARSRLSGEGSFGAAVAASGSALAGDVRAGEAALRDLMTEQAALAVLKGSGWEEKPDEGEFVESLARMYSLEKGAPVRAADLDSGLLALISRYFDGVDQGSKTPADILSAIVRASDRDRTAAAQALDSAKRRAREAQAEAMEGYRDALEALMEGEGAMDVAALAGKAAAAFARPSFVEEGHAKSLYALQADLGLAPEVTGNSEYEAARGEVLGGLKETLVSLYQQRIEALAEVRQTEWELKEQELSRAKAAWGEKMSLLVSRGMSEWAKSDGRFREELAQWRTGFGEEYRRKSGEWSQVLLGFQEEKKEWVDATAISAARVGSEQILAEVGQAASAGARGMASRIVTGISYESPDGERLLARLIPGGTLGAVLGDAQESTGRIASAGIAVSRGLGQAGSAAGSLSLVRSFLAEEREELSKRGALIVADQAGESLQEAREGYRTLVRDANEGFEAGMDRLFLAAGYAKGAGRYEREGIIGSTVLSGVVRERQEVAGYTPFPVPSFEVTTGLGAAALAGLSAEGIDARLSVALEELEGQREDIFGPDEETDDQKAARRKSFDKKDYSIDEDNGFLGEMWEGVTSIFGEKEFGFTRVEQSWGAGAFGAHIGFAPVFVGAPDPDKGYAENILEPGSGQLDHLVGWYGYYEMRVGKGLGEINAPLYDKPLWNDEGSLVEAPTLRTVADIGVGIAAILTGNAWAIAALNLADDALFGMADVAGGYKGIGDVGLDLGRKAVVGFATAGIGEIGGIAARAMGVVAGNAIGGMASAITWNEEEGWGWDSRVFAGSLVGRQAFAGYLGQAASGIIGATLSGTTDKFTAGLAGLASGLGGEAARWTYYLAAESLNNSDGLAAGQLAARAFSDMGGLTLNVANIGAFLNALMLVQEGQGSYDASQYEALARMADRLGKTGLLELTIGATGASLALGTGGIDLGGSLFSMGKAALLSALVSSYTGTEGLKEAMRQAYGKGDHAAEATIWRVLAGKDRVVEEEPDGSRAMTVSDAYGSRTIFLGRTGGGQWDALNAAVRLQHESWRNGVPDSANASETFDAVLAHTRLARALGGRNRGYLGSNGGLLTEVRLLDLSEQAGDLGILGQYAGRRYDPTEDFWKLVQGEDGRHYLEFDARADVYDESGNFLVGTGSLAVQGALAEYLGVTADEAAQVMLAAGMTMDQEGFWNRSTAELNLGQRIAIAEAADPLLGSYLFAAYHQDQVLDEVAAVVSENGQAMNRSAMREYLQETGEQYAARYQALRNALIDFYLGSGTVDLQQVDLSQLFGLADASTKNLYQYHTGIDSINGPLTELLAAWSGRVERSSWSDLIGNVVDVRAGYSFEGDFLSAGFSYGNAHLMDRITLEGQFVDFGALLGHSGNTGSQVVGQNGGYHNHFTIFDSGYGTNQYLGSILGLGDSSAWLNRDGTAWTYQYEPHDRRYYDPERIYTAWFRK